MMMMTNRFDDQSSAFEFRKWIRCNPASSRRCAAALREHERLPSFPRPTIIISNLNNGSCILYDRNDMKSIEMRNLYASRYHYRSDHSYLVCVFVQSSPSSSSSHTKGDVELEVLTLTELEFLINSILSPSFGIGSYPLSILGVPIPYRVNVSEGDDHTDIIEESNSMYQQLANKLTSDGNNEWKTTLRSWNQHVCNSRERSDPSIMRALNLLTTSIELIAPHRVDEAIVVMNQGKEGSEKNTKCRGSQQQPIVIPDKAKSISPMLSSSAWSLATSSK